MTGIAVTAVIVLLLIGLRRRGPRWRFWIEAVFTLWIALYALAPGQPLWIRFLILIVWPAQLRDVRAAAGPAGITCILTRQHVLGQRMLVDANGRIAGALHCADPGHDCPLPPGLTALPGRCSRCGRTV